MLRSTLRILLGLAAYGLARPADAAIDVQLLADGLPYLVGIEHAGDASGRLFLVRQGGQIMIYDGEVILATPFLDLSSLMPPFDGNGERGLLGLAFHPHYSSNGYFFVYYINVSGDSVIARYQVSADPNIADPASAAIVLTAGQPAYKNHKGGQIRFGPDTFLYVALGDGGSGGDPDNRAQSLGTVLGKLLRIDVNSGSPYGIPPSNPFVDTPGARGEIWAYGLRNPWRFSFDRLTGDLFIGDVGQDRWEEIDMQPALSAGGENYGWRLMEGSHCYNPSTNCNGGSLTLPIVEYSHALGCSVTGGFRYRGSALTAHVGTYFFSDVCSRSIWGATRNANGTWTAARLLASGPAVTTFGEDADGELYVSDYANGDLYRIVPDASPQPVLTLTKSGSGTGRLTSSPTAIECGSICGAALASNSSSTLTATPDPGSVFVGWSGDPDCTDGAVTMSADRSCTARFALPFTDSQLAAGATPIRAVHVTELRTRIDAVRLTLGLSAFSWTDPAPVTGNTVVKAIHVVEMRAALRDAFVAAGRIEPAYVDPFLSAGTPIKAAHITDLRQAVWQLE